MFFIEDCFDLFGVIDDGDVKSTFVELFLLVFLSQSDEGLLLLIEDLLRGFELLGEAVHHVLQRCQRLLLIVTPEAFRLGRVLGKFGLEGLGQ